MNWTKYLPCLLILGMGSGCSSEVKHPGENQDLCLTDSLLKIVSVDTVHLHDVADELTLNGRVTFNQEQVAHVYPMFGGTVTELRAEVGDYVRKGDILAILRSGEVADYERQMKEAEQQVIIARRNVNATRDMFDSGLASDKDVLQARQELINAEAEEDRIKEIFSINNFSGRSFYEVKSPVSGFIVEKSVSRNMQLRPDQGEEIFTVSGLEHVWVMADVYESDISKVAEGASVHITTLAYPGKVFSGNIDKVYHMLNTESKTMNVRVKLCNEDYLLKPGMFTTVNVECKIAGVVSFKHTPIDAFPDVTNTKVTIITQWAGRSAEEVEKFITIPVEIAMNSVQKKTDIRSTTLFGLSVINVLFEDHVDDFVARQQVYNLLNDADLPDGVTPEVQPLYGPTGEIYRYTLRSDKRSVRELKTIQDWVIDRNLRAVSGVADIVSFGGEVKTFEVSVNPNQLINYGITSLELYDAIAKSNINVGGDVITKSSQAYVVRGIGLINDLEELRNIVVKNINGTPILVKNLADVRESCLPRLGQVGRMDEDDVVEGIVVMRKGENPGEVISGLKAKIDELNENILPSDVEIVPFYDREDLVDLAVHTVTHNLVEGILLVTFIVFIFMADWRTTAVVAVIIPLALLFAFICLHIMGMSANLLSMGAIDFGIIIDGAVVMVEGIFVALDRKAKEVGMPVFNRMSKMGLIRSTAKEKAKAVFFSKLIIITALIPIFSFQKVEGKMFSPLAYTLGFALLGALIFTLTLVPVMSSILLKKNVRERSNFLVHFIREKSAALFAIFHAHRKLSIGLASLAGGVGLFLYSFLGMEFLPQLNEGAIYIRATLPQSISLDESVSLANRMRRELLAFPEVRQVLSQTGRPNDGTDATGFYNVEFHVDIFPEKEWESGLSKGQLIEKMQSALALYPGTDFNFSQPITDNVEEAASGVKGSIAVKVFGKDLYEAEKLAVQIDKVLGTVQGIEDLGVIRNIGQPELRIELNEKQLARYGVSKENVQSIIEMAIGGKSASLLYEDERKFNIMVRYNEEFRRNEEQIGKILVPAMDGTMIPIKELADIRTITGPLLIFRDSHARFCAVKFSVRGRAMGSAVAEAQKKVAASVHLPDGYTLKWTGDFENQQRASKRLAQVVPVSIAIIFVILFILFSNARDAGLVLLNVPFAAAGGIIALLITHFNFSISAGIGFIALFGICIQNGVIMISGIKSNVRSHIPLSEAVKNTVRSRVRPVVMTAAMAAIGLMPAALSHGIGSESQRPLAIVIIGGVLCDTFFTLFIFPLIVEVIYGKTLYDKEGKLRQRRV